MKSSADLRNKLHSIDHRSYPAYKELKGVYSFDTFCLSIDHVQGDPFASPSRISLVIDAAKAQFPVSCYDRKWRRIALQDHLNRLFVARLEKYPLKAGGSGKSGLIRVSRCGQEVLERSCVTLHPADGSLVIRLSVGFPANGRTIQSGELEKILFTCLPSCAEAVFYHSRLDKDRLDAVLKLADDQEFIRGQLSELGLCAFVGNGSILPRLTGVSDQPMTDAVRFHSPASMEVTLTLPHHGTLTGMGIRRGITLIAGGGYHGKSTLLKALEMGVYNHIAGDGREFVITDSSAVKIRAEDSRCVKQTDISLFINNLPSGKDTQAFRTEDASGSTSQAANMVEAIECGCALFLIDEDTCAANFMVRDELMQRVVCREAEPITPFLERARFLYDHAGVSTILVAGSSGAYFSIADCVLQMDRYEAKDITEFAHMQYRTYAGEKAFAAAVAAGPDSMHPFPDDGHTAAASVKTKLPPLPDFTLRRPAFNPSVRNDNRLKVRASDLDQIQLNHETIDLRYLEQLADPEQTAALAYMLAYAETCLFDGRKSLIQIVEELCSLVDRKGLCVLSSQSYLPADLALPRKQEIAACFNRYRALQM